VIASDDQVSLFPEVSVDLNRYNGIKFAHEDHNFSRGQCVTHMSGK